MTSAECQDCYLHRCLCSQGNSLDDWEDLGTPTGVPTAAVTTAVPTARPKMLHRIRDAMWGTLYNSKPGAIELDVARGGDVVRMMGGQQVKGHGSPG